MERPGAMLCAAALLAVGFVVAAPAAAALDLPDASFGATVISECDVGHVDVDGVAEVCVLRDIPI